MGAFGAHKVLLTSEERAYAAMRFLGALGLLLVAVLGLAEFDREIDRTLYLFAVCGFLFVGLAQALATWIFGLSPRKTLMASLPADLVWIGLITAALLGYEDSGYVVAVVWPIFYALILRSRAAWMVGGLVAAAYLCGHFAADITTSGQFAFLLMKAVAIILLTGRIAYSEDRQRHHEERIERASTENERLAGELRVHVGELQALSEISALLHSSLEVGQVAGPVLETISRIFGFEQCCMFAIEQKTSALVFSASVGVPIELALAGSLGCDSTVTDDVLGVNLACTCPFEQPELRLVFCAPAEDLERLSDDDRQLLDMVAREVAVAAENSRLFDLTRRMSITDELTGLCNYRFLRQRIEEEVSRAQRHSSYVSLLMIDADDFKAFNDMYGHVAGDKVLAELGAVLTGCVRESDLVARYGGEEFSVLLPETDVAGALAAAEKLRDAVAQHEFQPPYNRRLSVSIGLATYPTHGIDAESVLRAADDALYGAKNSGKNQVHSPGVYDGQPVW